eukprot:s4619_g6.t2
MAVGTKRCGSNGEVARSHCAMSEMCDSFHAEVMSTRRSIISTTDLEILRGITLRASLYGAGTLWRRNPRQLTPKAQEECYQRSRHVDHLDVFISHTWQSSGLSKTWSLLLQSGWQNAISGWILGVALAFVLCAFETLPLPFSLAVTLGQFSLLCPVGPWAMIFGFLGTCLGLFLSPYCSFPGSRCQTADLCFIDAACIHQTDAALMHRGIRGIGSFLLVSKELRILWSSAYLQRLWCVFELATYKKMNISGRICLAPLFVEKAVLPGYLGVLLLAAAIFMLRVNRSGAVFFGAPIVGNLPFLVTLHMLRRNYVSKHQLESQFVDFDLDSVQCSDESDKHFVHAAIVELYGSKEAFAEFVRGPLRQELLGPLNKNALPARYTLLLVTPIVAQVLDTVIGVWKAAPPNELFWLFLASRAVVCILHFPACVDVAILLCDRCAKPWHASPLLDYLQTFIFFAAFMIHSMGGLLLSQRAPYTGSWWLLLGCFLLFSGIRAALNYISCHRKD